jgi:hypothetical protein
LVGSDVRVAPGVEQFLGPQQTAHVVGAVSKAP